MSITAKTRVTILVEHDCGPWDETMQMSELREIAKREAESLGARVIQTLGGRHIKARLVALSSPVVDFGEK